MKDDDSHFWVRDVINRLPVELLPKKPSWSALLTSITQLKNERNNAIAEAEHLKAVIKNELSSIREFIASQDIDCFGTGHNFAGQTWPIRDEFIDMLTKKINRYK